MAIRGEASLVAVDASPVDAHAIADADPVQRILLEGGLAAIAHAHDDAITLALVAALLDLVARDRAADRSGDGRDVVAAPAADLVADHAADDAADDGAGAR